MPRVIPVLLLKNKGLVKTCKFRNPVYLGDPINAIKIFNEKEVDELIVLDIEASKRGKLIDWKLLSRLNNEAFMPLGYGGGIRTVSDIKQIINLGYEKVVINTSTSVSLIKESAELIGSQSLVVCVDIKKNHQGNYKVYRHSENIVTDIDALEFIKSLEEAGAGEIIVQSVDRDGTFEGYDIPILRSISESVTIPIVALGGASSLSDIKEVINTNVSGAAAGSMFVFFGRLKAVLITYPDRPELLKIIS